MSDISFNKNLLYSKTGIFYDELEHLKAASTYLTPNNYVVSSYTDEDLNTSYALYWINEDQEIIPLTYNIKEGNGLYLENNKWKLNIDNLSIKENIAYELYIDNEAIINAYGDMTKGVIKIDNDICHFNKYEVNNNNGTVLVNDNGNVSLSNRFLSLLDDLAFYKDNIITLTNEIDELIKITDEEMIFQLNVGDIIYYNEEKGYSKRLDSFDTDASWTPKYICVIASGILPDKKARIIDLRLDNYQPMAFGIDIDQNLDSLTSYKNIPLYDASLEYDPNTDNISIETEAIKYDTAGYIATNNSNWTDNYKNPFYKNEHYGFKYVPDTPISANFKVLTLDIVIPNTQANLTKLLTYALKLNANNPGNISNYYIDDTYYNTAVNTIKVSNLTLKGYVNDGRHLVDDEFIVYYPNTEQSSSFILDKYSISSNYASHREQSWSNINNGFDAREYTPTDLTQKDIKNLPNTANNNYYGMNMRNSVTTLFGAKSTNILEEKDIVTPKSLNTPSGILFGASKQTKYNYRCDIIISFISDNNPQYFYGCDVRGDYYPTSNYYPSESINTTTKDWYYTVKQTRVDNIDYGWRFDFRAPISFTVTHNDITYQADPQEPQYISDEIEVIEMYEKCEISISVSKGVEDKKLNFKEVGTQQAPEYAPTDTNVYPILENSRQPSENAEYNVLKIDYDITLEDINEEIFNNNSYYFLNPDKTLALKKTGSIKVYPASSSNPYNELHYFGTYLIPDDIENGLDVDISQYTQADETINFINSASTSQLLGIYTSKNEIDDSIEYRNGENPYEYKVEIDKLPKINMELRGTNVYQYMFANQGLADINLGTGFRSAKELPIRITIKYNFKISSCWYRASQTLYGLCVCNNKPSNGSTIAHIFMKHSSESKLYNPSASGYYYTAFNLNSFIFILPDDVSTPQNCIESIEIRSTI